MKELEENRITFEDIQKANESIRTTDIKGKDYAEVNQRIKAFRMVYPEGTIFTEMLSNENGVCIFKTTISNDGKCLATGTAYEKENSTFINKTSYIENCETSSIGRALGMCGFGIDTSVASAEEVQNAMKQQESALSEKDRERIYDIIWRYESEKKVDLEPMIKWADANADDIQQLSDTKLMECLKALEKKYGKLGN